MVFSGCTLRCAFFVPPFVDIFDSITLFWNCSQLSKIHPLHNPRVYTSNTYFLQRCFIYTIDVDGLSLIPADELAPLLFHLLPPLCLVMVYLVFLNAFVSLVPIVHLCFAISVWYFVLRWRLPGDKMLFSSEQHFYFGIGIASYFEDKKSEMEVALPHKFFPTFTLLTLISFIHYLQNVMCHHILLKT